MNCLGRSPKLEVSDAPDPRTSCLLYDQTLKSSFQLLAFSYQLIVPGSQ
jgi:hypothetical protein